MSGASTTQAMPSAQASELIRGGQARSEAVLEALLSPAGAVSDRLEEAMRYSVLGGGKRLRPVLLYAAGRALGGDEDEAGRAALDATAAALELVHAYSLVHDDLPAMDDDDLRRGQPTVHRAFDEATAILAGDALLSLAFEVIADTAHARTPALIRTLAEASGRRGMVAGQALDLEAVGQFREVEALSRMHAYKTGALIRSAVRLGGLVAVEESDSRLEALERYASAIGLAFQIQDDILDVTGDTATLGKTAGADAARDKPTYPSLLGLEGARTRAGQLLDEALDALAPLGEAAEPLAVLARYMIERDH
ncbi:polyprenyl synthetase family protein [Cobetia marina]|jgi:farnesyl diphosphate synthase/geranylgeranyl diphosphate synthase type II|uniref:Farnesyl diphosphate synthase n=2 Tax=Halomonadaceae TaxID=28256 RepID=A0ABU9GER1_COBMA|nr:MULTISPECIES: farnesyl diphosphate synthase [Cobetia]MDA5563965.1 polyprenyl synthetase family protein [Cobetia sp. MMG027]MDH2291766.1 polyprenyl synthetase family protein [Cobetia sp. 10Alg 146]MDH2374303.1 polyprenyl synthetase family protein [Cobetia sp. 3AK]MDI6004509.1 polyprenyl synthetase family protein [Cobetia pacifica]MDO6787459.1 polyprenyl synthetase family protein [Cobetia marina]